MPKHPELAMNDLVNKMNEASPSLNGCGLGQIRNIIEKGGILK